MTQNSAEQRESFEKDPKMVVWNMAKRQRDESQQIAEASDMLMQAIEVAPELDHAMQKAFRLQVPPMQSQAQTVAAKPGQPGYQGGAPR